MSDGDTIAQVAVVVLLLGLSVPALGTAYNYAGTPFDYSESVTVNYSSPSAVSENATTEGYGDSPTVSANGDELVRGTDYDWDADGGQIAWYNTTNTSDGQSAHVEYVANQRTGETEMSWDILSSLMSLFGLFGFTSAVRALWAYIAEVWDL